MGCVRVSPLRSLILIVSFLGVARPAAAEPAGDKPNLQQALTDLAAKVAEKYAPLKTGALDRLAVLNFDEIGPEVAAKQLGKVTSQILSTKLVDNHGVKLVERSRLDELVKEVKLQNTVSFDAKTAQQVGTFLGAQALLVGSVSEAGADYVISARLASVKTGEVLLATDVTLPREGLIALVENAVEKRTKVGAIYRAILPGWGQFYNGPPHYWKGFTIAGGSLAGIGTGIAMLSMASSKVAAKKAWDPAGDKYLAKGCDPYGGIGEAPCLKEQKNLQSQADQFAAIGYGALGLFGAAWLWGIVDAAVYGEDFDRVRLAVVPTMSASGIDGGAASLGFSF
jgi:TolB-like protein